MSSPISIPQRARAASSSSSSGSSSVASSLSSAPTTAPSTSPGLYVPVHKRAGGNSSSRSSSRSSSARSPLTEATSTIVSHPRIYTTDFLLSLRPKADESAKERMKALCPEVVMNRRTRKSLEFMEHQRVKTQQQQAHPQTFNSHPHSHNQLSPSRQLHALPIVTSAPIRAPVPAFARTQVPAPAARVLPRRTGPTGRRQALQLQSMSAADTWRGMRVNVQPLSVL